MSSLRSICSRWRCPAVHEEPATSFGEWLTLWLERAQHEINALPEHDNAYDGFVPRFRLAVLFQYESAVLIEP